MIKASFLILTVFLCISCSSSKVICGKLDSNGFATLESLQLFGQKKQTIRKIIKVNVKNIKSYDEPNYADGFVIGNPSGNIQQVTMVFNDRDHLFLIEYVYCFKNKVSVNDAINVLTGMYGAPEYFYEPVFSGADTYPKIKWFKDQVYISLKKISISNANTNITVVYEKWPKDDAVLIP